MLAETTESAVGVVASTKRREPTFLYIGGDRCGSKSLHRIFQQHPDCYVPPIADPYFFDKHYDRGLDWYLSLFKDAPADAKAIGEFSHDYLHSPDAAKRIARDLPCVKLLATLRHPIERTFSSYVAAHHAGAAPWPFETALRSAPFLIGNSLYADHLEPYLARFDQSQIKIQLFDDLTASPKTFALDAFRFVGLRETNEINYEERLSQLSSPRFPLAGWASRQAANLMRRLGWVNLLGRLKHHPRVRPFFYKPYSTTTRPTMNDETRTYLRGVFSPQIDRLEALLQRDLSHWRD